MQQHLIFGLHGFLGQSEDWFACERHLDTRWNTPALFSKAAPPIANFSTYLDQMISAANLSVTMPAKKIFVGYSMGGRLGLHLLQDHADKFDHFVFVSTHAGLQDENEKRLRLTQDEEWSKKILHQPWEKFIGEWNAQPVFKTKGLEPARFEKDFDVNKLSTAMKIWSLGFQNNLRPMIEKYQNKITWVVGSEDEKFIKLSDDLLQKKILLNVSRIHAGHRILFENPKALCELLQKLF